MSLEGLLDALATKYLLFQFVHCKGMIMMVELKPNWYSFIGGNFPLRYLVQLHSRMGIGDSSISPRLSAFRSVEEG
jgi:hypothetical protein